MRLPFRLHNFWPAQYPRRPSYFSLIHQPVGSMDGFQTFARSRWGVWFSVAGVAAAEAFSFAARLPARKKPAASTISVALHSGGMFMPRRLGNFDWRCQAWSDGGSR